MRDNGIGTEIVQARPGALALGRILDALTAGQTPDPADVDAVRNLKPTAGNGYEAIRTGLPAIMDDLHGDDPERQAAAWKAIAPLIDPDAGMPKEGVERFTDWGAISTPDREWLIQDWLPRGRIGMFSGKGGKGKTLLLLQMATAMAAGGGTWLGRGVIQAMPEAEAGTVVFASWEDEGVEFRRRLGWIDAAEHKDGGDEYESLIARIGNRFIVLDMARRGPVWGVPEGGLYNARPGILPAGDIVRAECEQSGASLLILDSLGYAYGRNDNDNEGVADFLAAWDSWGRDHGCTVALVHHPPKDQAGKGAGSGYRGASSWEMHSRWRWELGDADMKDGQLDRLSCEKASYAMRPNPVWLDRSQKTGWIWREAKNQHPATKEKRNTAKEKSNTAKGSDIDTSDL